MSRRLAVLALAGALLGACDHLPTLVPVSSGLREAPDAVDIGGASIELGTYLWRDFQPISPPDGRPLIAVLRIQAVDGTPLPTNLHADSAWVLNGDLAWAARVVEERSREPGAAYFEVVARDGPKWGPGIEVDVVVALRDGAGRRVLVQARGQPIHRTD